MLSPRVRIVIYAAASVGLILVLLWKSSEPLPTAVETSNNISNLADHRSNLVHDSVDAPSSDLSAEGLAKNSEKSLEAVEVQPSETPVMEWPSLKERMRRDHDGLEVVEHANGCKHVHLKGRFAHASAAVRNEDGTYTIQCFSDYDALSATLRGETKPPAKTSTTYETARF